MGDGDCCTSNLVKGGTFNRSNDAKYPADVSDFRLDNYEVTVGRFRKFVAAYAQIRIARGAGKNPNNAGDAGWDIAWNANLPADAAALVKAVKCSPYIQTWTDDASGDEALPMNCVNWYVANEFCTWDGGRLPTEAEWNYAAAGGSEQRKYPWGAATPDCSFANFKPSDYCAGNGVPNRVGSESPKGDGKWGQSDLAGNVGEWTLDWYGPYPQPCHNCSNSTMATTRVSRGGVFYYGPAPLLITTIRGNVFPYDGFIYTGVRCARGAP
jgi:formylglycine-generating enzyme required for sulfatase activity